MEEDLVCNIADDRSGSDADLGELTCVGFKFDGNDGQTTTFAPEAPRES